MKIFIHFEEQGKILSAAKVYDATSAHDPFAHVGEAGRVLELSAAADFAELHTHEISEQYQVDLERNRLKRKAWKEEIDSIKTPEPVPGKEAHHG